MRRWRASTPSRPENRPPAEVVFWTFRIMVGLGVLMLALGVLESSSRAGPASCRLARAQTFRAADGSLGFIAVIAGWITTEVGRQPFTVYGLLRTAESASPLAAPAVGASLIAFVVVYFAVFGMGSWYLLKLMSRAPQPHEPEPPNAPAHAAGITPARRSRAPAGERAMADHVLTTSGPASWRSPSSCTWSWTASISASACCFALSASAGARHRDEFHRAGVGRQRDLAGAGRRRICWPRFRWRTR
jgi:hypothetical protein